MTRDNYVPRRKQFMRSFDRLLARVKPSVSSWLGEAQTEKFMRESRQEYEALIPRIPFIGNSYVTLGFYMPVTRYLAVYRALQKQGRTVEEVGRLIYCMGTEEALAIPPLGRRVMEVLWFSRWLRKLIQKRAIKSQQRQYPADFVMNYVSGLMTSRTILNDRNKSARAHDIANKPRARYRRNSS